MPDFKYQRVPVTNELTPNSVANFSEFHLSHCNRVTDYGSETTAIVLRNNVFLILNGDHREALYTQAVTGGLQACFDYYVEHQDQRNFTSENKMILNPCHEFPSVRADFLELLGQENLERLE